MKKIIEIYKNAYKEHGNSLKAILTPKGRQDFRFQSICQCIKVDKESTVLDYGCGLGHLFEYIQRHYSLCKYSGVDIVSEFINENHLNYPNTSFDLINKEEDVKGTFDYILSAGVFNLLYAETEEKHKSVVYKILEHLFDRTKIALAVNFMTDEVDFQQDGAFHMNVIELLNYAKNHLTKRVVLDQSYMPYEFTLILYKNDEIIKPDNVYDY